MVSRSRAGEGLGAAGEAGRIGVGDGAGVDWFKELTDPLPGVTAGCTDGLGNAGNAGMFSIKTPQRTGTNNRTAECILSFEFRIASSSWSYRMIQRLRELN